VTFKLQLTVPKAIADQYGICPGDELEWIPAGESIRVELMRRKAKKRNETEPGGTPGTVRRGHEAAPQSGTGPLERKATSRSRNLG
jgi:bifunctional DNA-binding transcriptional regulator/antitoxin component of YhaV-PrlF toxin-antitoxin module